MDQPPAHRDSDRPGAWSAQLAAELASAPLPRSTVGALLSMARDVAHATERINAPLSTYVAGRYVEARVASGCDEAVALDEVAAAVRRLLSETTPG
ncbi:MAG: molybdopterin-guanine dinucleotide biosynthesis protein MobA [Candidatus Dormibacteraeota bacterium]|uniref:Molybdopterin-guanine dinucleotide biosynthesis protein MobA n=1 Tax=Candidatus Amunia macphersoniae TaxID=3127014 RepID=A0A934KPT7_9BACT|nr:molybdopterin-guanine dinucleotide biosynthesis protein MobA [Candidatus Dormibacteraeota bacterium]